MIGAGQFREMRAGDSLRMLYDRLSEDPNSLSNLDQVNWMGHLFLPLEPNSNFVPSIPVSCVGAGSPELCPAHGPDPFLADGMALV